MHHIQRKIINKLMHAQTLGYAQMRPDGVESNHFAYHLDQLLKAGYIAKDGRNYFLTNKGKILADRVSHENMKVRIQPQIVTSVYVTNDTGKMIMTEHNFQPYIGLYGAPQGRLHYEENVLEAAGRELREKTSLEAVELTHRGIVYIQTVLDTEIISKLLVHVFTGSVRGEPHLNTESQNGLPVWIDVSMLRADQFMPGHSRIHSLINTSKETLFFDEINFTSR